jgi:hypothetical protein
MLDSVKPKSWHSNISLKKEVTHLALEYIAKKASEMILLKF